MNSVSAHKFTPKDVQDLLDFLTIDLDYDVFEVYDVNIEIELSYYGTPEQVMNSLERESSCLNFANNIFGSGLISGGYVLEQFFASKNITTEEPFYLEL